MKLNLAIATSKVIDAKYPKIKKKNSGGILITVLKYCIHHKMGKKTLS